MMLASSRSDVLQAAGWRKLIELRPLIESLLESVPSLPTSSFAATTSTVCETLVIVKSSDRLVVFPATTSASTWPWSKPDSDANTRYFPGGRSGARKRPSSSQNSCATC